MKHELIALGSAALFLAALVFAYPAPPELWLRMDFNGAPFEDFMGPYFEAARALPGSATPPSGYHYPAFFAVALLPLAALGANAASWAWLALQAAAMIVIVVVPLRLAPARHGAEAAAWGAVVATAHPLLHGAYWGQVSGPIAALLLLAVLAGARSRSRASGALMGIATAIKLVPALFLLGPALRGDRRALGIGVATAAGCLVVPAFILLGPSDFIEYHREVAARLQVLGQQVTDPKLGAGSQDPAAAFARWIPFEGTFLVGRIAGFFLALKLASRIPRLEDPGLLFAHLALLAPLLVAPTWSHGLVACAPAAYFVWRRGGRRAATLAAVGIVLLSMGPHAALRDAAQHAAQGWGTLGLFACAFAAIAADASSSASGTDAR